MELEDVSEVAAGVVDLAGAAGVRALSALAGRVNTSFASSARSASALSSSALSREKFSGQELVSLLEQVERISRYVDSIKASLTANIIDDKDLPLSYGHKNHHLLLRDVTRSSYKQVALLTRMAETFNRVAEQAVSADEQLDDTDGRPVVAGELLVDRFTAGELDLETAVLIADTVNKTVKLDDELEAAGITPAETDLGADLGPDGLEPAGAGSDDLGVGACLARGLEQRLLGVDTHVDQMRTIARNSFKTLEIKYAVNPDELKRKQVAKRSLTLGAEKDGLVPIFGNLVPDTAALLVTAFDAINSPRAKSNGAESAGTESAGTKNSETKSSVGFMTAEEANEALKHKDDQFVTRSNAQARHDAFTTLIQFGLQNDETPMLGGEAATLIVTTTLEDLKNTNGTATVTSPHGGVTVVDAGVARHTACVGSVLKVTLEQGKIVALHSLDRVFTRKMRKAILARDGGCIIPRCTVPANWCEVHHVTEHAKGGPTSVDNGVTLCWFHHRYLDSHGWVVGIRNGVATARRVENTRNENQTAKNLRTGNTQAQNRRPANERTGKKPAENERTDQTQAKNRSENRPPGDRSAKNGPPEKAPPGNKNQRISPSKNGPPRNKSLRDNSAKNILLHNKPGEKTLRGTTVPSTG